MVDNYDFSVMKSEKKVLLEIGEKLKKLRIKKGYTSYESFAIDNDLSRMQYWRIEKGLTNITIRSGYTRLISNFCLNFQRK